MLLDNSRVEYCRKEYDECIGCIGHHSTCAFKSCRIPHRCPCLNCLVKVTCTHPCYIFDEELIVYRNRETK